MADKKKQSKTQKMERTDPKPIPKKIKTPLTSSEVKFPIVGIGASAGGLEAIEGFFAHTPDDIQIAFVIIQHLAPEHKSIMGSLLEKYTKLKVSEIRDGMKIHPGCIYLNPPNKDVAIINDQLVLTEPIQSRGARLPIDYFFRSLAETHGDKSICIVLSGTGSDGTLGLKAVKAAGGLAMVQEEKQARYDNMPRSAIDTGLVDFVLPVEKMADQLMKYVKHPYIGGTEQAETSEKSKYENYLQKIFVFIRASTGHDFSQYKTSTIKRRIERRMAVHQIENIAEYVVYLQKNPIEIKTLFKDMLITVTNFFRDTDAFKALYNRVILPLAKNKSNEDNIRVWTAGCATGEEAYSIAILIAEAMKETNKHFSVQIFATDIDAEAVAYARNGIYPDSISADVSAQRLKNYFVKEDNAYKVKKQIREMVIFATQNLIKDAPFSKLDLACCRNVLIYMNPLLQKRILPLFHYTLLPEGYLFLGTSETTGENSHLFSPVDAKWKIFKRRRADMYTGLDRQPLHLGERVMNAKEVNQPEQANVNVRQIAERTILQDYAPPCVLTDDKFNVLYFHGDLNDLISIPSGEPTYNLLKIIREDLRYKLDTLLRKCQKEKKLVKSKNIKIMVNQNILSIDLQAKPVTDPFIKNDLLMVTFESIPQEFKKAKTKKEKISEQPRVAALEQELHSTKEYLQTTIEELETSNEELKSANEELQSTNEELQSTNEELETSREELQSTNEELETVNSELQNKVEQLSDANNDLNNLLGCTEIATIFLDNDINIKRFTPKAADIFKLINTDIGRPISDIVHNLFYEDLVIDAREVLKNLGRIEKEIHSKVAGWYTMRILPYRTVDNTIDGVVVTFNDITKQKKAEEVLKESLKDKQ